MVSIAIDHNNPAQPKGCPLKRSSTKPKGTPDHTGNRPGRINRHASSIKKPKGGSIGCCVKNGRVVTIDATITDDIGIASIFRVDGSRSKRLSYSLPGRSGKRIAVTGFFTPLSLWFGHRARLPVGRLALHLDRLSLRLRKANWRDLPMAGQAHRHLFCE